MSVRSLKNIDVTSHLRQLLEFYEDETTKQKVTAKGLKGFRAPRKNEIEQEVEEAEGETDEEAVAGAIPASEKEEKKEDKPKEPEAPVQQQAAAPTPSYDLMREKMNLIRSGKSLKDEAVDREMRQYFEEMDTQEKMALIAFLTGISQIVAGEVPARKVPDPSEPPYKINMTRDKKDKEKTDRQLGKSGGGTGSPDSPIVVGEAADKSRELDYLKKVLI